MEDGNLDENKRDEPGGKQDKLGSIESALDLVETVLTYFKEQVAKATYDSIINPMEKLKSSLIFGIIGGFLLGTAVIFLALSVVTLLSEFVDMWISYLIIASILIISGMIMLRRKK